MTHLSRIIVAAALAAGLATILFPPWTRQALSGTIAHPRIVEQPAGHGWIFSPPPVQRGEGMRIAWPTLALEWAGIAILAGAAYWLSSRDAGSASASMPSSTRW